MTPAKALMMDTLWEMCSVADCVSPKPFFAAMILRSSSPAWGIWYRVCAVQWVYRRPESYERLVLETGFWPSSMSEAHEWAAKNVAPPPFFAPCTDPDFYSQQTMLHDLRYFASVPRVLDRCPWLPERLSAVELLEEIS